MGVNKRIAAGIVISVLMVTLAWAAAEQMSVQVKSGALRTAPSFLARITGTLAYGDRVEVLSLQNGWHQVRSAPRQVQGWIHASALTPKKIVLRAGADDVEQAASSDELALAGKGFNRTVEGEYREKHRDLDYRWVDRMERMKLTDAQIQKFLRQGDVRPEGGAQ
jgi:hypothetical protein